MYRIDRMRVRGFRRLFEVDIPVRPLMVLIGANGVGKTSLLNAFSLLSATAAGSMREHLSALGGVSEVVTRGEADSLELCVEVEVPEEKSLVYDLQLAPGGVGYSISSEVLSQLRPKSTTPFKYIESHGSDIRYYDVEEGRLLRPNWDPSPLETSLAQVPKMYTRPEELRRMLASMTYYHALDVGPRAPVKLPQQMKPAGQPGANGEDLVSFLFNLRESDIDRYDALLDTLKAAFPGFEGLNFPPVAAGMLAMTWKDAAFKKPLYMNELSEGTLRFLWLAALLQSPGLSKITLIDEPEVSLHPELLGLLAELMRAASKRTQLLVATHSDRLVRFLRPDEVVVMDIDEKGFATATWADTLDLDAWLAEYSLDELWLMGRMGGRA